MFTNTKFLSSLVFSSDFLNPFLTLWTQMSNNNIIFLKKHRYHVKLLSYTYGIKYYLANSFNYCCYIIIKVLLLTNQFQIKLDIKK